MSIDDYDEINEELFMQYESICFITLLFFNLMALDKVYKKAKEDNSEDEKQAVAYSIGENVDSIINDFRSEGVNNTTIIAIFRDHWNIDVSKYVDADDCSLDEEVYDMFSKEKVGKRADKIIKYLNDREMKRDA